MYMNGKYNTFATVHVRNIVYELIGDISNSDESETDDLENYLINSNDSSSETKQKMARTKQTARKNRRQRSNSLRLSSHHLQGPRNELPVRVQHGHLHAKSQKICHPVRVSHLPRRATSSAWEKWMRMNKRFRLARTMQGIQVTRQEESLVVRVVQTRAVRKHQYQTRAVRKHQYQQNRNQQIRNQLIHNQVQVMGKFHDKPIASKNLRKVAQTNNLIRAN